MDLSIINSHAIENALSNSGRGRPMEFRFKHLIYENFPDLLPNLQSFADILPKELFLPREVERVWSAFRSRELAEGKSLLQGYLAIAKSRDKLKEIEVIFLAKQPFEQLLTSEYVRFMREAFLDEVYRLSERLSRYAAGLTRRYLQNREIENRLKELSRLIFRDAVILRNEQVHSYGWVDLELTRSLKLELEHLIGKRPFETSNQLLETHRKEANLFNTGVREYLEVFFEIAVTLVFDENGRCKPSGNPGLTSTAGVRKQTNRIRGHRRNSHSKRDLETI